MQPPRATTATTPQAVRQPPPGRALGSMAAALGRVLARIDARLLAVLDSAYPGRSRDVARLEATLLLRLRRGIAPNVRDPASAAAPGDRIDSVLADGLLEAVDAAATTLSDLEGEAVARHGRCLSFCHELLSELVALGGGEVGAERRALQALKERLQGPNAGNDVTGEQLAALFVTLAARLEQCSPLRRPTLLDEVLRGTAGGTPPAPR